MYKLYILTLLGIAFALNTPFPCIPKNVKFGIVCVCNSTYCDTLNIPESNESKRFTLVTSSKGGERFSYSEGAFSSRIIKVNRPVSFLYINTREVRQQIHGFGTAISGAVTYVLNKLSPKLREYVYNSYYSSDVGMGYEFMRVPIGGTDFEYSGPWAYNETPEEDISLSNFTQLDQRDVENNFHIREMMRVSKNASIKVLAAAWSPPRWLKVKYEWENSLGNELKPEYYQTWANYHLKWLDLMEKDKVKIFALSTGNEPATAATGQIPFQILGWRASNQAKWIAENLGPTIANSNYSHVQIHGYDDNRDKSLSWISEMKETYPKSMSYIQAFNIHGYLDRMTSPSILDQIHWAYKDKPILYSEMSFGAMNSVGEYGPRLGSWERAEQLINILISALNHFVVSYIDWNMILDQNGGPNYIKNYLDAMIMTNADFTELYKQPLFYAMAHFSRFIPPKSVRIDTKLIGIHVQQVQTLAFLRPDKKISVILYNNNTLQSTYLKIMNWSKGLALIELKPKSINTFIYSIE
ncbi:putative glucosylceramidase 4 [Sitodiplosis mosellana]|uniref:putative glucosylceramidase 4 n=1 Tax=Sitodiplosis mosellana TaxID=263140 RepID=UPI0024438133|nr:putative glucosylceramidase 4 [Sitodiplosis mosellana]